MPYRDKDYGRKHKREYERLHRKEANERSRKFYSNHKEEVLTYFKEKYINEREKYISNHLAKRYGITPEQYNDMFIRQDGKCAICGRHQSELSQRLSIDHCHKTGIVRGLLCKKCNAALGLFSDKTELLECAIEYLEVFHVA